MLSLALTPRLGPSVSPDQSLSSVLEDAMDENKLHEPVCSPALSKLEEQFKALYNAREGCLPMSFVGLNGFAYPIRGLFPKWFTSYRPYVSFPFKANWIACDAHARYVRKSVVPGIPCMLMGFSDGCEIAHYIANRYADVDVVYAHSGRCRETAFMRNASSLRVVLAITEGDVTGMAATTKATEQWYLKHKVQVTSKTFPFVGADNNRALRRLQHDVTNAIEDIIQCYYDAMCNMSCAWNAGEWGAV